MAFPIATGNTLTKHGLQPPIRFDPHGEAARAIVALT